jgi:hypothetical protein
MRLEEHHDWWERIGSREAMIAWLEEQNPNLSIHLVPQDLSLSSELVMQIGQRWCDRVQRECFPRNPKTHLGRFVLFAEQSGSVGWHLHGVGWMPTQSVDAVASEGERWLIEETAKYFERGLPESLGRSRCRLPTAVVNSISTAADRDRSIRYSAKFWSLHGKSNHIVISCRNPHRA